MHFVCRWREDVPLGKRVITVPDATVLDWFRRGWDQEDPSEWVERELGGYVYGLDSIFEEAQKRKIPPPATIEALHALLDEHLYVEGDPSFIRLDQHSLRVRTDDDEVDLAYYFVDDIAADAYPERVAFLLHDTWPLPVDAAAPGARFTPDFALDASEATFSVRLSWESPETDRNLDLPGPIVFPGVTLPGLAASLRSPADPVRHDARLLRALIGPGEDDIGPALRRYTRLPGYEPAPAGLDRVSDHGEIHQETVELLLPAPTPDSLIEVSDHMVQVARHIDNFFGYDQWFLFDTQWAAANPILARSLLTYAQDWDPLA